MHLAASHALTVSGRLKDASPMTASARRAIFLKQFTSRLGRREGGVQNALTHHGGVIDEGGTVDTNRWGWEAIPYF